MLNKRFKIAKCKTSLKLATSRIKLMKNKKGIQINQMKKELAHLLESGDDRTARIRVEHVIREEKMVSAYELVEIYCELIVARLPIIESQKTCPIDLKEAITSVIFAAPRCSDISELIDVRKQFTAKYGKEFVSGAIELRPDCGVSRMLVEKLSAIAPDVQTKMKVLSAVAKEHNVNWDPTSFEEKESKPPDDLLNGPANFEKISTINVDPPKIQTPNVDSPKVQTPNVQNVPVHEGNPNVPFNFSEQNRRYTLDSQKSSVSTTHEDRRSSGMTSESMNKRQSFNSNHNDSFSSNRENWNMEFKDATSAAQAAAESAERASMAARAAAHLSSQGKVTRQYSNESYDSQIQDTKPQFSDQHHFKDSYNRSFNDRNPKLQTQEMSPKATERFSRPTSLRSRNDSVEGSLVNNLHHPDGYEDHGPSPSSPEMSKKKESKDGFMSSDNGSFKSENVDRSTEKVIRKQPSIYSSRSHSSALDDDLDLLTSERKKVGNKTVVNQGKLSRKSKETSSYGDDRKDDETDSDDDNDGPKFDTENTRIWSPRRNATDLMDSAKSMDPSVNLDHSDGPDSESENAMEKKFISSRKQDHKKPPIELYDLIESDSAVSKPDDDKSLQSRHSSRISHKKDSKNKNQESQSMEDNNNFINRSDDLDTGNELKFGTLTGGLRNKSGLKFPPYTKTTATPSSPSSNKPVKEIPMKTDRNSFNSRTSRPENKKPTVSISSSESDSEDYTDKYQVQSSTTSPSSNKPVKEIPMKTDRTSFNSRTSRPENKKPTVSISSSESDSDDYTDKYRVQSSKTRSQFAPPDSFFNDDSEEESPPVSKTTSTSKIHLGSAVSRRTKGYVEPEGKTVISSSTESYSANSKKDPDRTPKSWERSSNESERKSSRISYSNKQETFKQNSEPKISERPLNPPRKNVESGKTEASESSNPGSGTSVEANNDKKPSHVHPKLPEYDSLAARMQALRMNRQ